VYAYFDAAADGDNLLARDTLELWRQTWMAAGWVPEVGLETTFHHYVILQYTARLMTASMVHM
jgi:hypothetical protein